MVEGAQQVTTPDIEKLLGLPDKWRNEKNESDNPLIAKAFDAGLRTAAIELEAAGLNELLADYERLLRDEVGWLIERGHLCLGFSDRKPAWVTFTNAAALRFARRSDAIRFIEAFRAELKLDDVIVTNHLWAAAIRKEETSGKDNQADQQT